MSSFQRAAESFESGPNRPSLVTEPLRLLNSVTEDHSAIKLFGHLPKTFGLELSIATHLEEETPGRFNVSNLLNIISVCPKWPVCADFQAGQRPISKNPIAPGSVVRWPTN